jgi:predicted nucleotidyltransferase
MSKNLTKGKILHALRKELPVLREKYGVERVAIYGSFAKGNPTEESDVDILVQLSRPLGLDFVRLASHIEDTLGRKVDLATFDSLKRSAATSRRAHIAVDIERTLTYV